MIYGAAVSDVSVTLAPRYTKGLFPPALRCDRHRYVAMCSTWTRCAALHIDSRVGTFCQCCDWAAVLLSLR